MESEYQKKLQIFTKAMAKYKPDVIALQEIMQPIEANNSDYPCINAGKIPLKEGNHALNIVKELDNLGLKYNFVWLGFKRSYESFDEGLVIMTPHKIINIDIVTMSPFDKYDNWKTRKALGVLINGQWFYSIHMGWWDDPVSPLQDELKRLQRAVESKEKLWLMGDFNSVAEERGKGYDMVASLGLYDTYNLAVNKDEGITAYTDIDGWGEKKEPKGVRIDYIFSSIKENVESSFTIFNGRNEERVSDHFGIIVTTGREDI